MSPSTILIISGTNRPQSNAMKVARILDAEYRAIGASIDFLSLTELPAGVFDGSAYAVKPPAMEAIQRRVLSAGGLHIVTPEYNGSFPGVLKYFVDMLKFPESFERKPVAFVGEAQGMWGGLRSVEQLSAIFAYRNAHIFPARVFISGVDAKFNPDGKMLDEAILKRLKEQAAGFREFVDRFPAKK